MDRGSYERELAGRPPTSRGAAFAFGGQVGLGGAAPYTPGEGALVGELQSGLICGHCRSSQLD